MYLRQERRHSLPLGRHGRDAPGDRQVGLFTPNDYLPRSCFANQGEICLCTSRLFVHQAIFDRFVAEFVKRASAVSPSYKLSLPQLRVGDPESADSDLGAMVSKVHFDKVAGYIELARKEPGVRILCGGAYDAPAGRCSGVS